MILRHFPKTCPPPGWPNLLIHARGRQVDYPEHPGPLSLKCVFEGKEIHEVGGISYSVDSQSVLLLNHGRPYASRSQGYEEVETFSLFFEERFAAKTLRSLVETQEELLDEPFNDGAHSVEFFETLYPRSPELTLLLRKMRAQTNVWQAEPLWLEERLHEVLAQLLRENTEHLRASEGLLAGRATTRAEQYRRLLKARDFINGNVACDIDLASIGEACCLSSFHLQRLFKQAFGETPHQYLTRRRLERARDLLATTDLPIWEICQRVGYQSQSSFSRLISAHYGAPPLQLRRQLATG
jgi:AraC family transcriptional regulator